MRTSRKTPLRLNPLAQALAAAALLVTPLLLQAQVAPHTLPQGVQVVAGQARLATQGAQMTVSNSNGAILNWQSFNIGAAAGVHFEQAGAASKVLNRVTGHDPSHILGSLTSNGQVWLLNPNGVLFGAGARVDVAGLVAGTLRLNDNDFLAGRYRFASGEGAGAAVRNEGSLRTSFGGQIVLLGERVENTGEARADGGSVTLAAARSVELVDTGLPNLAVRVQVPAGEALNLGHLVADGGTVDVYGGIVNQQGLVQADTLGTDAQGRVVLRAGDTLTLAAGSQTRAGGERGGALDLLGTQVALLGDAAVDASGSSAGGSVRVGGGVMGRDTSVPNARAVFFGPQASIRASATGEAGSGGSIVLWADAATRAYGTLSARGGSTAGDGGFIETSGGWIDARPAQVDVSARGRAGTWLIDPNNILINDTGPDTNITGNPNFGTTGDSSVISTATIAAALNAGNSVSITTGTAGANSQAGDILMANATLAVTPGTAVGLTMNAARDIVVRDSTITSTAAPLSITLNSAGSGIGAIEILRSGITTAGGDVTLQGTIAQQLTLPDGSLTATAYRPAVGYFATTPPSNTTSGGTIGVNVEASTLNLGAGTFRASGTTSIDNRDGLRIGSNTGAATVVNAASIDLFGHSFVANPINIDVGILIKGDGTDITATNAFRAEGSGLAGLEISGGARVALNAAVGSGAVMTLIGRGGTDHAVSLAGDDLDTGAAGRGSRITVNNASLAVTADATLNSALLMTNDAGAPGPLLDLSAATGASFTVTRSASGSLGPNATYIRDVDLVLPTTGTTSFGGDLGLTLERSFVTAAGGTLNLAGASVTLLNSNITSTGGALAINVDTTGSTPLGVQFTNAIVTTNGGDITFGASQTLPASVLPATTVAANWLRVVGSGNEDALDIDNSVLDAGSGRITGGGATTSSGASSGVVLTDSSLIAREISLAGRSDAEIGVLVSASSLSADRVLALDGLSAGTSAVSGAGLLVATGSTLQMIDPGTNAGSRLALSGNNRAGTIGTLLVGGPVGSGTETRIVVGGAPLTVGGITSGGSTGLAMAGDSGAPGGLLFNTLGATAVTLQGSTDSGVGAGLELQYATVLGPQGVAGAPLQISGNGIDGNGFPGTRITDTTVTTGGTLRVLGDGLLLSGATLSGEAGVTLHANTGAGAPAGVPISLFGTDIVASGPGAQIRIEGSTGGAATGSTLNSGVGIGINQSSLSAPGAGSAIVINGEGAAAGGSGVTLNETPMSAESIGITGRGRVLGDGVFAEDLSASTTSVLAATNLTITGFGADNTASPTRVGVRLGSNVELQLQGRGAVLISGDQVLLGNASGAPPRFRAGGDAASFTVLSTDSQRIVNTTLDFSTGSGTDVTLRGDSNTSGGGRARLENSSVDTGGGNLLIAGEGVRRNPTTVPANTSSAEGALGVFLIGSSINAGAGTVTVSGTAPNDGTAQAGNQGNSGLGVQGTTSIGAGSISLSGDGGDYSRGVDVGVTDPAAVLNLSAPLITVSGRGTGIDIPTGLPNAGVVVNSGSTWATGPTGTLDVISAAGPLSLAGAALSGRNISLQIPETLVLGAALGLNAAGTLDLNFTGSAPVVVDNGSTGVDSALLSSAVAAMSSTSTVRLAAVPPPVITFSAPLSVPGRLEIVATAVDLQSGAALGAGAAGDAFVARGPAGAGITSLTNTAGASALSTPAGRWVLLLDDPRSSLLGGLASAFSAYDLSATPWALDAQGNYITPAAGNAVGYGVAAAAVSGSTLAGTQSKVYDASATLVLDPLAWSVNGLVAGDTLTLTGTNTAQMSDKNVGSAKPVTPDAGTTFAVLDAQGRPVFGYAAPVFTATVTPAPLLVAGTAAASKVYDAGTAATLASLGSVVPLGSDNVFVATASASFSDKNAGVAKPVAVTGLTLGGTDAANYTAVLPTGLTADITPLALPVTGLVAASRVYDGTTAAALTGTASISPLAGDTLALTGTAAGSFTDKNVGTAKPVVVGGLGLAGTDAGNYTLVAPAGLTASITPAPLAVTGLAATARVYDGSSAAPLTGTAAVAPLAGDTVTLAGAAAGAFADANVGLNKAVVVSGLTLAGTDAANYTLVPPTGLTASVSPATLTLAGLAAANKVYDATTAASLTATLAGVIGTDAVSLTLGGQFGSAGVGAAVPVTWTAALAGAAAGNYQLAQASGSTSAAITPATLSYVAAPATGTAGQPLPALGGSVSGLQGADTLATSTTGTLAWSTTATVASAAGSYPVTGGGLSALNYVFVQAPGNATALTLRQPTTGDAASTATTVVTTAALGSVTIPTAMSSPTEGRVLDATPAFSMTGSSGGGVAFRTSSTLTLDSSGRLVASPVAPAGAPGGSGTAAAPAAPGGAGITRPLPSAGSVAATLAAQSAGESGGLTFEALDWGSLPRDEVQTLLAARARYKQKVFERSVFRLQQDPSLADVQPCRNERELESGSCVITEALKREIQAAREQARQQQAAAAQPPRAGRRVVQAALPAIERKLALLIGVNTYKDKRVPELRGAVPDAQAVRGILEGRLGYETTVLENPGREEIVRAFNRLALQAEPQDSVIIYYAGHGVLVDIDGTDTGFWLPSDVDAETPSSWLSNADIARMVAAVGARQLMMVSDSCYSGQLVGKERVGNVGTEADELLKRKAAVVMSSGGDEPVADEGKNGHSVFAWHFMRALEGIQGEKEWQPGNSLFDRVKAAVVREFPQTPQYGASRSAGHQGNTDYLWERRQLEQRAP